MNNVEKLLSNRVSRLTTELADAQAECDDLRKSFAVSIGRQAALMEQIAVYRDKEIERLKAQLLNAPQAELFLWKGKAYDLQDELEALNAFVAAFDEWGNSPSHDAIDIAFVIEARQALEESK